MAAHALLIVLKSVSDKSTAARMDSIRSPISERGDAAAGVNSIDSEHGQGSRSGQRIRVSCCVVPESMWQRSSWAYLHAECACIISCEELVSW